MPRKILIVDDKPFMVRLIQHHLERAGYRLIKARNRQEALQAIAQQSPELVVMDESGTPGTAVSVLNNFHSDATQKIPVIRMTDVPQETDQETIETEVVLTKPFSPTRFIAEVKRLVPDQKLP